MPDTNERNILNHLHAIRSIEPPAGAAAQIVRRLRAQQRRRPLTRWIATFSAAAAVLIIAMLLSAPRTSIADEVAATMKATTTYQGWVHVKIQEQGAAGYSISHVNNITGTWAMETHSDHGLDVHMYFPAQNQQFEYTTAQGNVRIGEMPAGFAHAWTILMREKTLTSADQLQAASWKQSTDGSLIRYEATFPAESSRTVGANPPAALEKMTVWADAATKLLQKQEAWEAGKKLIMEWTYGGEIKDVYALGVPASAPVDDVRPGDDVKNLLARLQKHYDDGLGDYIALETSTDEFQGKPEESSGTAWLYARHGNAWGAKYYLLGDRTDGRGAVTGKRPPRPAGWPTPTLEAAIETATPIRPTMFVLSDGAKTFIDMGDGDVKELTPRQISSFAVRFSLEGRIWPTRESIGLFGGDSKASVLSDEARPGIVALRIEALVYYSVEKARRKHVETFWFDAAKDDVPVERFVENYSADAGHVETQTRTLYTQWDTAAGKWYPAARRIESKTNRGQNASETRLQLWAGKQLPPEWFQPPK